MATQQYRIVSGEDSEIHNEPHIEGSRITVRDVYVRVEERHERAVAEAKQRSTLTPPDT